ncbi:hypothetical protein M8C21_032824, partial [Ambrosia artemisiifolia]
GLRTASVVGFCRGFANEDDGKWYVYKNALNVLFRYFSRLQGCREMACLGAGKSQKLYRCSGVVSTETLLMYCLGYWKATGADKPVT